MGRVGKKDFYEITVAKIITNQHEEADFKEVVIITEPEID